MQFNLRPGLSKDSDQEFLSLNHYTKFNNNTKKFSII
jgi:hypothetical protein